MAFALFSQTDHAYLKLAQFTNDLKNLDWIDWVSLKERNFKKDDIDRFERYQAEALVHEHMPISSLAGIVCYNSVIKSEVEAELSMRKLNLQVLSRGGWYFQ